ncbi:hypothetical protein LX64_00172 [Chitinophaga skermanii]|uniref:Uncharacterized protein n=1 Tax=Chitinophaga skermanii TaxID=331697 RepID=A0A327R3D4_9BACT|nr:hypothetical protein [Chitinophaga skermanii]RAJ10568.1 hypothetical protein LX64_00172 [Chitinophaga skermanii]
MKQLTHQYTQSPKFINQLDFDSFETYALPGGYVLTTAGGVDTQAQKTNSYKKDSPAGEALIRILQKPVLDIPMSSKMPIYRNAIVFYNAAGTIVGSLNVDFDIDSMAIDSLTHINADAGTYTLLRDFFEKAGHASVK